MINNNEVIEWVKHQKKIYQFDDGYEHDVKMYDEVIKRLEQVKKLNIDDVSKCYTEKDMDNAYDKGFKDGATNENEMH
tara:strand:- start:5297 stop:5530 length:234 start_codon:yes stop_codon:yes gene_type:complete